MGRAWQYGALAMEFVAGVIGGLVAGYFVDGWVGTRPLFTVCLLLLGAAGGLIRLIRGLGRLEEKSGE